MTDTEAPKENLDSTATDWPEWRDLGPVIDEAWDQSRWWDKQGDAPTLRDGYTAGFCDGYFEGRSEVMREWLSTLKWDAATDAWIDSTGTARISGQVARLPGYLP